MHKHLLIALAAGALAPGASSQKVCISANLKVSPRFQTPVHAWFAVQINVPQPMLITAADFLMAANPRSSRPGQAQVGIWNASGGKPSQLLAKVAVTLPPGVIGWYGGKFAKPVVITKAGTYFVAVRSIRNLSISARASGTKTPYFWGPPVFPWRGPIRAFAWSYRVYCGLHGGSFFRYGKGKPGSGSAVPQIGGLGQPNTTNTIAIILHQGLGGAKGALLFGKRQTTVLPIGTLWLAPLLALPVALGGSGNGRGWHSLSLQLANNPSWKGLKLAAQGVILDAGASFGLSHTGGLEITIGH